MENEALVAALERLAIGAVDITTRALGAAAPAVDLTFPQWRALLLLGDAPDGARISVVAVNVGVTVPATSRMLRRLEHRGLVALAIDETDRRATRARLTTHGADVRARIMASRRAALGTIAAAFLLADGSEAGQEAIRLIASIFEGLA